MEETINKKANQFLADEQDKMHVSAKWISVHNRTPPNKEDVLVTDGSRISIGDYSYSTHQWSIVGSNYIKPTHWMLLPNLPKPTY